MILDQPYPVGDRTAGHTPPTTRQILMETMQQISHTTSVAPNMISMVPCHAMQQYIILQIGKAHTTTSTHPQIYGALVALVAQYAHYAN